MGSFETEQMRDPFMRMMHQDIMKEREAKIQTDSSQKKTSPKIVKRKSTWKRVSSWVFCGFKS